MKPEYKLQGKLDVTGPSVVLCKLRFEGELMLSSSTLKELEAAIGSAKDAIAGDAAIKDPDQDLGFLKQLHQVVRLAGGIAEGVNPTLIREFETAWRPFDQDVSLASLLKLSEAAGDISSVRVDYSSDGEFLVFQRGLNTHRTRLDEATVPALLVELRAFKDQIDQAVAGGGPQPKNAVVAGAFIIGAITAIEAWLAWREYKKTMKQLEDDKKAQEEAEKNAANEKDKAERVTAGTGGGSGGGGPGACWKC